MSFNTFIILAVKGMGIDSSKVFHELSTVCFRAFHINNVSEYVSHSYILSLIINHISHTANYYPFSVYNTPWYVFCLLSL